MALQKNNVSLSFKEGVDTKTDPKQVVFGKLLNLLNAKFISPSRIQKRNGYTQVGPTLSSNTGVDVIAYNDELVSYDGTHVYSFSQETNTQVQKGAKLAVDLNTDTVIRNNYYQVNPDSAIHSNNVQMFVYTDSQALYSIKYTLIDTTTGNIIARDVVVDTNMTGWKVKVIGNYFVISYVNKTNTALYYRAYDVTTNTLGSRVTLASDLASGYDVCSLGSYLYFAYSNTTPAVAVFSLSSALVKSSNTTLAMPICTYITITADTVLNEIWVFPTYFSSPSQYIRPFILNTSLAITHTFNPGFTQEAPTFTATVYNGFCNFAASSANYQLGHIPIAPVTPKDWTFFYTATRTSSLLTFAYQMLDVRISSKAFLYNTVPYVPCVHISNQQSTYFVLDFTGSVISKIAYGNSWYGQGAQVDFVTNPQTLLLSETNSISATQFQFPYLYKDLTTAINNFIYTQSGINSATLTFNSLLDNKILANDIHTSGGILSMYDGANVVEHGFNLYPENVSANLTYANGGLGAGNYQYSAVYEWMDNQGNIHRSAPSTAITQVTSGFNFTATTNSTNTLSAIGNSQALYPGIYISGSGIPANTYIVSVNKAANTAVMSAAATSSVANNIISTTPNLFLSGTINTAGQVLASGATEFYVYGSIVSGSNFLYCYNTNGLKVGMALINPCFSTVAFITAISGNIILMDQTAASSVTTGSFYAQIFVQGSCSSGSPNITTTIDYRPLIAIGDVLTNFNTGFTGPLNVLNVTATSITVSANASSSSAAMTANRVLNPSMWLNVGDVITSTSIPGSNYTITSISDTLSNQSILTLDTPFPATPSSTTVTFKVLTNYSVLLAVPYLNLTDKIAAASKVILSIYRTEANGTIFYRVSSLLAPIFNDVSADYYYFMDYTTDYQLISHDQLYTTGGEVDNIAAPATSIMTTFKNRLIAVPQENQFQFWYSKQVIPGSPVEFSDVFVQNVDQRGGKITAVGAMDDKLILFKTNSIYYVVGDGPTPAGTFNDFSAPILITTDCGCTNKKSIVVMPEGLMFKSSKGIYLLTRALEVKYIGAEVEAYNQFNVTSAQLITTAYEVRFTLDNGVALVFDYYVNQWGVHTNINASDATVFQNQYTYITPTGTILKEASGVYTDNGAFIQLSLTTSWLSFAGLQGYERFYDMLLLGDYKSPHTLNVQFAYDFNNTTTQTVQIPVTSDPGVYQYRIFPVNQKCEAFQITIFDTQDSSFGEGFDISALIMRVGIKAGTNKMAASKAYG